MSRVWSTAPGWFGIAAAVLAAVAVNLAMGSLHHWFGVAVFAGLISISFFLHEVGKVIASDVAKKG